MDLTRRFLLASSLARLVLRERVATQIVEGHFPASDNRLSYVLFEDSACQLVLLANPGSPEVEEERSEVPVRQGQFLLDVCAGTLAYQRTFIGIRGAPQASIISFSMPGRFDLVEVAFEDRGQADAFDAPFWFGPEVTGDPVFDRHAIATNGPPEPQTAPLSDASVHAVLDLLERDGRSWALQERGVHGVVEPFRSLGGV